MILFLLLCVEEDVFKPELPPPRIKPDEEWVFSMERNEIITEVGPHFNYHRIYTRLGIMEFQSFLTQDIRDHHTVDLQLKTMLSRITGRYEQWDSLTYYRMKASQILYNKNNLLLGKGKILRTDDLNIFTGELKYYHSFPQIYLGFWGEYLDSPDYGIILQKSGLRAEIGKEKRAGGVIGKWGYIKAGRFRGEFPLFQHHSHKYSRAIQTFYGARIDFIGLKVQAGRKNFYTVKSDSLRWAQGETDFIHLAFERDFFGFKALYQRKGYIQGAGEISLTAHLGNLAIKGTTRGVIRPEEFLTAAVSFWIESTFSPYFTISNIAKLNDDEGNTLFFAGIRYAD